MLIRQILCSDAMLVITQPGEALQHAIVAKLSFDRFLHSFTAAMAGIALIPSPGPVPVTRHLDSSLGSVGSPFTHCHVPTSTHYSRGTGLAAGQE